MKGCACRSFMDVVYIRSITKDSCAMRCSTAGNCFNRIDEINFTFVVLYERGSETMTLNFNVIFLRFLSKLKTNNKIIRHGLRWSNNTTWPSVMQDSKKIKKLLIKVKLVHIILRKHFIYIEPKNVMSLNIADSLYMSLNIAISCPL